MKVKGMKAIVTGGASGLGRASAEALVDFESQVWIADADRGQGEEAARKTRATFIETDVTSEADVDSMFAKVGSGGEPARILVNCAGVAPAIPVRDDDGLHCMDAFDYILKTNIGGTFLPITRFAQRIADASPIGEENGVVINVSSIAAFEGQAGRSAYAASKGAIAAMTLPLARELAALRIRVVTIAPGLFNTPMLDIRPRDNAVGLGTQAPHPARLGRPAEFAALACHKWGGDTAGRWSADYPVVASISGRMEVPLRRSTFHSDHSSLNADAPSSWPRA